jgi:hypothetical protein
MTPQTEKKNAVRIRKTYPGSKPLVEECAPGFIVSMALHSAA